MAFGRLPDDKLREIAAAFGFFLEASMQRRDILGLIGAAALSIVPGRRFMGSRLLVASPLQLSTGAQFRL
jgi:hypothetical protein